MSVSLDAYLITEMAELRASTDHDIIEDSSCLATDSFNERFELHMTHLFFRYEVLVYK